MESAKAPLPLGARVDAAGGRRIDLRVVAALALPLMANGAVQLVLNLTDTWFIGQLSAEALAAIAVVQWPSLLLIVLVGGITFATQTIASQSEGAGRRRAASKAVWTSFWALLAVTPVFLAAAYAGGWVLAPFRLDAALESLALDYWEPRLLGAPIGLMMAAVLAFFNAIARPRYTLAVASLVALANVVLNYILIFRLGLGLAGAAWATNAAQLIGLVAALTIFLGPPLREHYDSHLTWKLRPASFGTAFRLGVPMGLMFAADLLGLSLFQVMQAQYGIVDAAATVVAMTLTAAVYMPGVGMSQAGATLVGQAFGARDFDWAQYVGQRMAIGTAVMMGILGLLLALAGPWLTPLFIEDSDPNAVAVASLAVTLLWVGAIYQFFDGLFMASSAALRGAGDVRVAAWLVLASAMLVMVPVSHLLTFPTGGGWIDGAPGAGWGAPGGWLALTAHVLIMGTLLFLRWRSGAWRPDDARARDVAASSLSVSR
jgi:multidrug resistance protein, MATE family